MPTHNNQRYHFIMSSFSRIYGVEKVNQEMKIFTQKIIDENIEIEFMDLLEFDKYIQQMFEAHTT